MICVEKVYNYLMDWMTRDKRQKIILWPFSALVGLFGLVALNSVKYWSPFDAKLGFGTFIFLAILVTLPLNFIKFFERFSNYINNKIYTLSIFVITALGLSIFLISKGFYLGFYMFSLIFFFFPALISYLVAGSIFLSWSERDKGLSVIFVALLLILSSYVFISAILGIK